MRKVSQKFFLKPWIKGIIKSVLPEKIIENLRHFEAAFNKHRDFNHKKAQKYELEHVVYWMKKNKPLFDKKYLEFQNFKDKNLFAPDGDVLILFFNNNQEKWGKFASSMKDKTCLEIGSGPIGILPRWHWIKNRVVVEPLLNDFKRASLELYGKTFFTDDIKCYSQNAEIFIPELENRIDGCIISTNALDHSENPILVLENISKYSVPGCLFLFWSTLYYLRGHNEGHRNIIDNKEKFENLLNELGFKVESVVPENLLPQDNKISYGCIARKIK